MKFLAMAINAPTDVRDGAGIVGWQDGKLDGDPHMVEAAQAVKEIAPTPHDDPEPVDWSNAQHARAVLKQVLTREYGDPIHWIEDGSESATRVQPSVAKAS